MQFCFVIEHERQPAHSSDTGQKLARVTAMPVLYPEFTVVWFFDRDGQKLRYEIRRDRAVGSYRLVITHPDGRESVEEVEEPSALIERSVELMNSLRGDGWDVA